MTSSDVTAEFGPLPDAPLLASVGDIDYVGLLALNTKVAGSLPKGLKWLDDDRYVVHAKPSDDTDSKPQLIVVDAVSQSRAPLYDAAAMTRAFAGQPKISDKTAARLARRSRYTFLAGDDGVLLEHRGALYTYRFGAEEVTRLTAQGKVTNPRLSPDGKWVGFVRDHDLHVVSIEGGPERRLTTDGEEERRNGRLDWVYQEEIYGRGKWDGYWWSPDSARIAFLQLDETPVGKYVVLDHIPVRGKEETWRYPKAGDPNPNVRVGVVNATGGTPVWVDLDEYPQDDRLVVSVSWTPDSERVAVQVTNRIQNRLDLLFVDPDRGAVTRLFREEGPPWVDRSALHWVGDDRFLWTSTRDGFAHLYLYRADGTLDRRLTSGEWEVSAVKGVDKETNSVFAMTDESGILGRNLWRIPLDGSARERITTGRGTHGVKLSPGFKHVVRRFSHAGDPGRAGLYTVAGGEELTGLGAGKPELLAEHGFIEPEFVTVPNGHGFDMEAMVTKPPNFDPSKRYPVFIHIYGGPHSPMVRDHWMELRGLWHSLLAHRGYIVWTCDPQSASGKGDKSAWEMYRRAGRTELRDVHAGIDWLVAQGWADPDRIGIFGWSYGGFMALYCLTHSDRFKMGIAGAPVTDWRNYDTIYTERFMGTPQDNEEGYAEGSVVAAAKDLHGALLLIHGTMDENVHLSNTLQFSHALQAAGKQFDLMLYAKSRHGVGGKAPRAHLYRLMTEFIFENL